MKRMDTRLTGCGMAGRAAGVGLALAAMLAVASPAQGAPILGAEAAGPVKAWFGELDGLKVKEASIDGATITIRVSRGCVLQLDHPSAPGCDDAQPVGNAVACWVGKHCPKADKQTKALAAAGPVTLPWRETADGAGDGARGDVIAARKRLEELLATSRTEEARALLLELAARDDVRPQEWFSLVPVLAAVGGSAEAWRLLEGKELARELGPQRLAALRIGLAMGPGAGAAAAAGLLERDDACRWAPLAGAWLTSRQWAAGAELAQAIRTASPDCLDAWLTEVDALTALGQMERHATVCKAALDRFGADGSKAEQLAPVRKAWTLHHADPTETFERLLEEAREAPISSRTLEQLVTVALRREGRAERLLSLQDAAADAPDDALLAYLAGAMLRYYGDREGALPLLERAGRALTSDATVQLWIARDAFVLGDRRKAEAALALAQGIAGKDDPAVALMTAEVTRDTDPRRAQAALEQYWQATRFALDPRSVRQQRVAALRDAIAKCVAPDAVPPCEGPWELTFDVRKQKARWEAQLAEDTEKVKEWEDAKSRRKTAPPKELPAGSDPRHAGHQGADLVAPAPILGGGETHQGRMAKEFGHKKHEAKPDGPESDGPESGGPKSDGPKSDGTTPDGAQPDQPPGTASPANP